MPCCCQSTKPLEDERTTKASNNSSSRGAPGKESMKRGSLSSKMDDDTRAVDWWRHHQQDSHDGINSVSKRELDQALPGSASQVTTATAAISASSSSSPTASSTNDERTQQQRIDQTQVRMQQRNPLETPYDISRRELPIQPKNGNILKPDLLPKETLRGLSELSPAVGAPLTTTTITSSLGTGVKREHSSTANNNNGKAAAMEIFEAEHSNFKEALSHTNGPLEEPTRMMEEMSIIAKVDSMDQTSTADQTTATATTIRSGPKQSPSRTNRSNRDVGSSDYDASRNSASKTVTAAEKKRKKLPLSKFMEKKSKQSLSPPGMPFYSEASDHLSDVPSDVDSVTRERYLLACQMLKTTMIQKETSLIPIEKEFILTLLGEYEMDGVDSVVSDEHVTAIERAALRLEQDPTFQYPLIKRTVSSDSAASVADSSTSGATRRRELTPQKQHKSVAGVPHLEPVVRSGKNPHTATRKPKSKSFINNVANACNPKTEKDANFSDSVIVIDDVVLINEEEVLPDGDDEEDPNLKRLKNMDDDKLVRFDGWSFQKSAEYPFLILGAGGENLSPRVMTPSMMEALRGFMPYRVSESNFWLKFSLVRDGASLPTLLATIRASVYTLIGVETDHGEVFGCFTGSPWRIGTKWFGTGEAFLWRLKKPRYTTPRNSRKPNFENEMEVYPFTGYDDLVQYCTAKTIAVGGGDWMDNPCPFDDDTKGIGFMIDGDLAGGETNSCATFANPRLARNTTTSSEFTISNMEVWTLTPCINVKDAARMEMQKLFIEENAAPMR